MEPRFTDPRGSQAAAAPVPDRPAGPTVAQAAPRGAGSVQLPLALAVRARIPQRLNLALAEMSLLLSVFQVWVLPTWLVPRGTMWLAALLASLIFTPFQWAVLHEALHGLLLRDPRRNEALGRVLGVAFGVPFHLLRFGHLAHHRLNRCEVDRPEVYDPRRSTWAVAALRHYTQILGGMYFGTLAAGQLALAPRPILRAVIGRTLRHPSAPVTRLRELALSELAGRRLGALRVDALGAAAALGGALAASGQGWGLTLAVIYGRGLIISLLDNAYHYGMPLHARQEARNLTVPRWCKLGLLNMNLHRAHHRFSYVPWRSLPHWAPELARPQGTLLGGVMAQLRGPVPLWRVAEVPPVVRRHDGMDPVDTGLAGRRDAMTSVPGRLHGMDSSQFGAKA